MNKPRLLLALLAWLTLTTVHVYAQNSERKVYLLKTGKFYDSEKNQFLLNQQILIEGSKIVQVAAQITLPKGPACCAVCGIR